MNEQNSWKKNVKDSNGKSKEKNKGEKTVALCQEHKI